MKKMEIYEPAMCCSTGLCGVSVNPELLRISTNLQNLKTNGIVVSRFNLSSSPSAFVTNESVSKEVQLNGIDTLPLIIVDNEVVIKGRYPSDDEFCSLLEISCEFLRAKNPSSECCCGKEC